MNGPVRHTGSDKLKVEHALREAVYSCPCCTVDSSDVSTSAALPSIRRGMAVS